MTHAGALEKTLQEYKAERTFLFPNSFFKPKEEGSLDFLSPARGSKAQPSGCLPSLPYACLIARRRPLNELSDKEFIRGPILQLFSLMEYY